MLYAVNLLAILAVNLLAILLLVLAWRTFSSGRPPRGRESAAPLTYAGLYLTSAGATTFLVLIAISVWGSLYPEAAMYACRTGILFTAAGMVLFGLGRAPGWIAGLVAGSLLLVPWSVLLVQASPLLPPD